ncbi:hypothetical protein Droror1_Dr00024224 [Drosera rotundifolia]
MERALVRRLRAKWRAAAAATTGTTSEARDGGGGGGGEEEEKEEKGRRRREGEESVRGTRVGREFVGAKLIGFSSRFEVLGGCSVLESRRESKDQNEAVIIGENLFLELVLDRVFQGGWFLKLVSDCGVRRGFGSKLVLLGMVRSYQGVVEGDWGDLG